MEMSLMNHGKTRSRCGEAARGSFQHATQGLERLSRKAMSEFGQSAGAEPGAAGSTG